MTMWLMMLAVVTSYHIIVAQSSTDGETCSVGEPLSMLKRLLGNPQQLLQELQQLQEDNRTNHQLLQQLQHLQEDHHTNQNQLLQLLQQLFHQQQTVLGRLGK